VRVLVAAVISAVLVGGALLVVHGEGGGRTAGVQPAAAQKGEEVDLDPAAVARARRAARASSGGSGSAHPQLVVAVPPGQASDPEPSASKSSSRGARAQTDKQIERDLELFRKYLATIPPTTGKHAEVISSGEAAAPFDAPQIVIEVVQAANEIARTPYRWGGGHSAWRDKGYDCSGSVSFALAAAGLLGGPLTSTGFMRYGAPGKGRWITIYANNGHAFMTVAGLRFDTGGLRSGTRWQSAMRDTSGFVARHPPGF
jgi:cell wall-associated NlpC family hydrolase